MAFHVCTHGWSPSHSQDLPEKHPFRPGFCKPSSWTKSALSPVCFLNLAAGVWDLSSLTRDWTPSSCIGGWILNHWTTRGVLHHLVLDIKFTLIDDTESTCNAGDLSSIPGLGRFPGEGKGYPLQYSSLENSMDCIILGVARSRTQLSDFHYTILYYSFLPYVCGYCCTTMAELVSTEIIWPTKLKIFTYLALYRKKVADPCSRHQSLTSSTR